MVTAAAATPAVGRDRAEMVASGVEVLIPMFDAWIRTAALYGGTKAIIKNVGLHYRPTSGARAAEREIIESFTAENDFEIAIRANDPITAMGVRTASWMGLPAKAEKSKAKTLFGFLWDPLNRQLVGGDLDIAWVKVTDASRPGGFRFLTNFSARGMETLSRSAVTNFAMNTIAPSFGLPPLKLAPWAAPKPLFVGATSNGLTGLTTVITTDEAMAMAAQAEKVWETDAPTVAPPTITVLVENLPGNELGEITVTAFGANGLPSAATIDLSPNAAGVGWYVDATPLDHSEFGTQLTPDAFAATGASPAASEYDLFTALLHEEGHVFGFDTKIRGFALRLGPIPGSEMFVAAGLTAAVISGSDDLNPTAYPDDLMSLTLSPGERRLPSPLDVQIIDVVRGIAPTANGGPVATLTTGVAFNAGAAPQPALSSMIASVVAAVDRFLASADQSPSTKDRAKKAHFKTEHGKIIVKGPLAHG